MRAAPDLPDHIDAASFVVAAVEARAKAASLMPLSAMSCYSIAALQVSADVYERIAEGEFTFDALMSELIQRQGALAALYGVEP